MRGLGYGVQTLPHIYHPFLMVIFSYSIQRARIDAQRADSTLIEVNRESQARAGMGDPITSEINVSNIVFSSAVQPDLAILHAHWARSRESLRIFQGMTRKIKGFEDYSANGIKCMRWRANVYVLDRKEEVKMFRHDLKYILSWGTTDRMKDQKASMH